MSEASDNTRNTRAVHFAGNLRAVTTSVITNWQAFRRACWKIDYDASRLMKKDVEAALGRYGIPIASPTPV